MGHGPPMTDAQRAAAESALPVAQRVARRFARRHPAWWDMIEEEANYQAAALVSGWDARRWPDYGGRVRNLLPYRLTDALRRWGAIPGPRGHYLRGTRPEDADLTETAAPDDGAAGRADAAEGVAAVRARLSPQHAAMLDDYLRDDLDTAAMAARAGVSRMTAQRRAREVREAVGAA